MVIDRKREYSSLKKAEKARVAWDIFDELKAQNPPARFLKKDYSSGSWFPVPDKQVRRKISQCLRERSTPVIFSKKRRSRKTSRFSDQESFPSSTASSHSGSGESSGEEREGTTESSPPREIEMPAMPPLVSQQERQISFQSQQRNESPVDTSSEEEILEAPAPSIPMPNRFGGVRDDSMRTLSGLFSFGPTGPAVSSSFDPSIFDTTSVTLDNGWESLYDPLSLPKMRVEDAVLRDISGIGPTNKRVFSQSTETVPMSNCQGREMEPEVEGRVSSVDLFFTTTTSDMANLGRTPQQSHIRSYSNMDSE